jgi:hypothetical protein
VAAVADVEDPLGPAVVGGGQADGGQVVHVDAIARPGILGAHHRSALPDPLERQPAGAVDARHPQHPDRHARTSAPGERGVLGVQARRPRSDAGAAPVDSSTVAPPVSP